MQALLDVILPVFLVIGLGYGAARLGKLSHDAVDGVMVFAQNFAIPILLFRAISKIDLSADLSIPLFASFYIGAFAGFGLAFLAAMYVFSRPLEHCIAIGFCGMFSNSVLLGLAITERAYGTDALRSNYAIISFHAPLLYAFGIMFMETSRSRGKGIGWRLIWQIVKSILSNAIVVGILAGFAVNITGLVLPAPLSAGVDMMAQAALPAALFGLGGVLVRYRPEGDMKAITMVAVVSLVVHPAITYGLGKWVFALDQAQFRSAVLTAAMAPGVNTYLFANMYGAARRVAASAVLIGTAVSILSVWVWLAILP
jgi:malonate transporter